jgi:ADP-heptose:LPS heptosyltransferase
MFSRFSALLLAGSGARVRVGFANPRGEGLFRGWILTHPVAYNPHMHIAKNFLALTEPLFSQRHGPWYPHIQRPFRDAEIEPTVSRPDFRALDRVDRLLRARGVADGVRCLIVNVNAGDFLPQRKWPKTYFAYFIELILEANPRIVVLLTGSPSEREDVDMVRTMVDDSRCLNIAGEVAFEDLPALYAMSSAMLTNDSGPAHFASTVGLRTYVFFGPETPKLYQPLGNSFAFYAELACSPCVSAANHRNTGCTDNQCLKVIPPETVFAQIHADLNRVDSLFPVEERVTSPIERWCHPCQ